jgi:methylmalonyl-CoA mutase
MKKQLFQDFISHTNYDWKQQVINDLKGKDFNENLTHIIDENSRIKSYFDADEAVKIPINFIQQSQNQRFTKTWSNREIIRYKSEKETNALIISLLEAGADSFLIDFSGVCDLEFEINKLLRDIKISDTPFFFKVENNALNLVNALQIIAPYHWKGGIDNDILGRYFSTGIYDVSQWEVMGGILGIVQKFTAFKTIIINGNIFHNSGANVVQELAFTLASAIQGVDKISEQNISLPVIIQKLEFAISVGTNYFVEIAKIRALKFLWRKILVDGYGLSEQEIPPIAVHCTTSSFYNSSISPHTNLLRATTEAMSAVIGGCDSLSVRGFDETFQESNNFSRRISRNISTILREESYFDKVIDPSAGSYFIENLTFEIAKNAFKLLQDVENKGGIVEAFKQNFIQDEIKRSFEQMQNDLLSNEKIMVGVNKFRSDETPFIKSELLPKPKSNLSFDLLTDKRLSSLFETSQ